MYSAIRSEKEAKEVRELADAMCREWHSYLLAVAFRNAACGRDAEDAVGEAFAAFIRAYDPGGKAPPLAWLMLTVKRECWRKKRWGKRFERQTGTEPEREHEETGAVIEAVPSRATALEDLVGARDEARHRLGALKADQRTGLGLFAAGFSYKEIAARRGWTYTKVNRCIKEGRAALAAA
jgi:DNA-directed RNA polymerase specialized sigma24 family protein